MLVLTKSGFVVISILLASKLTWILIRFEIRMNNELRIYLFEKFLKGFSIFGICNLSKTLILVECNPIRWARAAGGWIWMIVGWVLGGLWGRQSSGCEWNRSKYLIVILITPDRPPTANPHPNCDLMRVERMKCSTSPLTIEEMPNEERWRIRDELIHLRFHFVVKWKFLVNNFVNISLTLLRQQGVVGCF